MAEQPRHQARVLLPQLSQQAPTASQTRRSTPDGPTAHPHEPAGRPAAWLHDVIEDTGISATDLAAAGIHPATIEAVILLTRTDGVPDDVYYRRISNHPVARAVKLADIADNTAPDRVARLTESDRTWLAAKYAKARQALGAASEATR